MRCSGDNVLSFPYLDTPEAPRTAESPLRAFLRRIRRFLKSQCLEISGRLLREKHILKVTGAMLRQSTPPWSPCQVLKLY